MVQSKGKAISSGLSDNALARSALEAVAQIEREAQERKRTQLETLVTARETIQGRLRELEHQLAQIDQAMTAISGKPAQVRTSSSARRNWDEVRGRVYRWLEGHKSEKYTAGDLAREFPELAGASVSPILKPFLQDGRIQADYSEGAKRPKYFVAA
jgi:hypothetical protein